MKITYTTEIVECSHEQAMNEIVKILHERGINNIKQNDKLISFKKNEWEWGSNAKAGFSADEGYFVVTSNPSNMSIDYIVYISIWIDIAITIIAGVLGTFTEPIIYLFGIGIIIQLFARIHIIRQYNKELLDFIRDSISAKFNHP